MGRQGENRINRVSRKKKAVMALAVMMAVSGGMAVPAHAEDPTFTSYAAAQKYVYSQMNNLTPVIRYRLAVPNSSIAAFDKYSSTSCSTLGAFDNGSSSYKGDYVSANYYGGDEFSYSQGNDKVYFVSDKITYTMTPAQKAQYEAKKTQVLKKLNLKGNTYNKVSKIYKYICGHVDYSKAKGECTAYHALIKGRATCNGYACLMYDFCRSAGIPCKIITGQAGGGYHAWNIVKIGKSWYSCDSTWDAGESPSYYEYFLRGTKEFYKSHKPLAKFRTAAFKKTFPQPASNYKVKTTVKKRARKALMQSAQSAQQSASQNAGTLQQKAEQWIKEFNEFLNLLKKNGVTAYHSFQKVIHHA